MKPVHTQFFTSRNESSGVPLERVGDGLEVEVNQTYKEETRKYYWRNQNNIITTKTEG